VSVLGRPALTSLRQIPGEDLHGFPVEHRKVLIEKASFIAMAVENREERGEIAERTSERIVCINRLTEIPEGPALESRLDRDRAHHSAERPRRRPRARRAAAWGESWSCGRLEARCDGGHDLHPRFVIRGGWLFRDED
jgi:hypothetical protein